MKLDDAVWGAVLMVSAAALALHVRGFPAMPGQHIGPGVLPGALAVGLGVCGAILLVGGLRRRARAGDAPAPWVEWPEWMALRPQLQAFSVLVAVNLLYLLAADRLGFVLTGVIYLAALMRVLRVPWARALPIAVVMTLVIHYAFYKLLRVPLPWGLLQPIAW